MSSVLDEVMPFADVTSLHSPEPRRNPLRRGSLFLRAKDHGRPPPGRNCPKRIGLSCESFLKVPA
jgi:hypothetical protein